MLFNTVEYFVFLLIVGIFYFLCPFRCRWLLLLIASYHFYMSWNPLYPVLLLIVTLSAYGFGLAVGLTRSSPLRVWYLWSHLAVVFGILFVFKYFNFFGESVLSISGFFQFPFYLPRSDFLLPVGISFYTFQSSSYVIDVLKNRVEPERHLGRLALYISFFPQLVAGPIERAANLLPQIRNDDHRWMGERLTAGLQMILFGLFKKMVIADNIAPLIDPVFADPGNYGGLHHLTATVLFAFQIFCDFSGYTDIALGSALLLGYHLTQNFNQPYAAVSISDFWRRWNISVTGWFRDYVYISLGGNRVPLARWQINLLAVFLLSGLWHGANWTFVAWGLLNALYLMTGLATRPFRNRFWERSGLDPDAPPIRFVRCLFTFILVCFGWIFFRAESMSDAILIVSEIPAGLGLLFHSLGSFSEIGPGLFLPGLGSYHLVLLLPSIVLMEWVQSRSPGGNVGEFFNRRPVWVRWPLYYVLFFSVILFGRFGQVEFIYFQF